MGVIRIKLESNHARFNELSIKLIIKNRVIIPRLNRKSCDETQTPQQTKNRSKVKQHRIHSELGNLLTLNNQVFGKRFRLE